MADNPPSKPPSGDASKYRWPQRVLDTDNPNDNAFVLVRVHVAFFHFIRCSNRSQIVEQKPQAKTDAGSGRLVNAPPPPP